MGLKESKLEANFTVPVNQPEHLNTRDMSDGPCLRIYAAAISNVTFPFLSQSEQLQRTLARIIDNGECSLNCLPLTQSFQAQMQYGSCSTTRHMHWEGAAEVLGDGDSPKARGKKRKASDAT